MENPATKKWKTLLRVTGINEKFVNFIIPSWDVHKTVKLPKDKIPENIWPLLKEDKRLHAFVNIGAEKASDLEFEDWKEI